jgi:hypothetical protein
MDSRSLKPKFLGKNVERAEAAEEKRRDWGFRDVHLRGAG